MSFAPSPEQLAAFDRGRAGPVVLFYEYSCREAAQSGISKDVLKLLAAEHRGALRWAAHEEEILCGRIAHFQQAALIRFGDRADARRFVLGKGHAQAAAACATLQAAVLSDPPPLVALVSALLARVLPHWPFDDTLAPGEEPGVDTSTVMPTSQAIAAVRSHPQQATPVVMINWLKFKPVTGRAAYHRYGKVAMTTTHSLGAKLLFAARYRMMLIGNGGDPGEALWDEFALMQYPGRATFGRMAQLRRYRAGLPDREAGLAEHGQGLTISRPEPEFVWRR